MNSSKLRFTTGTLLRMGADTVMIHAAVAAALGLRLFSLVAFGPARTAVDNNADFWRLFSHFCTSVWPLTAVCLVVFYLSGFYTYGRAYQSRYKALIVAQGVTLGFLIFSSLSYLFSGAGFTLPRTALVLSWLFCLLLLVGSRIWTTLWATIVSPEREAVVKNLRGERRVLVIGGGGYIGSALLPKLLEKGYHVRLLDLLIFGDDPIRHVLNHPRLEVRRGDFRHVEQVADALRGVDSVVHLGAIVGDPACNLDEELTIEVNLTATRMIAELAKASGVQRLVFASTCSVYGATEEMLDERSIVKPISLYGHTKLASERVLLSMANDQFRPTILRFSTIYGLSGRTRFDLVVNLLTAKAKLEGKITVFGGDQWRPFVHVDDAALAVATVLEAPEEIVANQIFNVGCNDQNYTIQQIGEMVHECVFSAELIANSGDTDKRNYRVNFNKIRNQLGFTPQWTVRQGIQQVLDAIANGEISDYADSRYSNVKFLSEKKSVVRDNWAHELVKVIASQ
ncbi:MAG TPA: SDR family oxidoreductase [Pirellulales bacterium]|nr:SDR family oxidoreductase [Pirellulales bacterium]